MNLDLSTDTPPSPGRTRDLALAFAAITRALAHDTMHAGSLDLPNGADLVLRDLAAGIGNIPQVLSHLARMVATEDAAGRIGVPSGEWAGRPHAAVAALRVRLDVASATAGDLHADLKRAARVTSDLASAEDGTDG